MFVHLSDNVPRSNTSRAKRAKRNVPMHNVVAEGWLEVVSKGFRVLTERMTLFRQKKNHSLVALSRLGGAAVPQLLRNGVKHKQG